MNEELKALGKELWHEHRGKIVGTLLGAFLGASVLLFGFWKTLFVVLCALVGLLIGIRVDRGDRITDFLSSLRDAFPYGFHRWR